MAAIITEQFRKENANMWLSEIGNNKYYIGIGQQNPWSDVKIGAPYPRGTYEDENRLLEHLTGLFKIAAKSINIPKVNLVENQDYKVYDPMDPTCFYPDKENGTLPCYAIRNDIIYLCIWKDDVTLQNPEVGKGMILSDIENAFDQITVDPDTAIPNSLKTYGIKTVPQEAYNSTSPQNRYTWAYLGETNKFDLTNSKEFVAINNSFTDITEALKETSTYALATVNPPGEKNDFVVRASINYPGTLGNKLNIRLQLDTNLDKNQFAIEEYDITSTNGEQINGVLLEEGDKLITYRYGQSEIDGVLVNTTSGELVTYIDNVSPGTSNHFFDVIASGFAGQDGPIGELQDVGPITLNGGATSEIYISDETGGLLYGFTVLNGGKNYYVDGILQAGLNQINSTSAAPIYATLKGIDIYGNEREEKVPVNVEWYNDLNNRENCHITKIKLSYPPEAIKPVPETGGGELDELWYKLRSWKKAKITLEEWTAANGFSDPILYDNCNDGQIFDVRAHIIPAHGLGYDKTETLPAWYIGLYTDTHISEYIPEGTSYHQISVIKEPLDQDYEPLNGLYYQPLGWFELTDKEINEEWPNNIDITRILPGWKIYQGTREVGVLSHIQLTENNQDNVALPAFKFYYYQDQVFGYIPITTDSGSGSIIFRDTSNPTGNFIDTGKVPSKIYSAEDVASNPNKGYQAGTGTVIFQDNRDQVIRSVGQNEEIKLVIQL